MNRFSLVLVSFVLSTACASGNMARPPQRRTSDASAPSPDAFTPSALDAAEVKTDAFSAPPDRRPSPLACTAGQTGSRLHLETLPSIGACDSVWTIVLWGAGGAHEQYESAPGRPLDVSVGADWAGWAAATAYCGSWAHPRPWETMTLPSVRAAGMTVEIDGVDVSDEVLVCYDPGGGVYRPLIPIECGLDPCPGSHY